MRRLLQQADSSSSSHLPSLTQAFTIVIFSSIPKTAKVPQNMYNKPNYFNFHNMCTENPLTRTTGLQLQGKGANFDTEKSSKPFYNNLIKKSTLKLEQEHQPGIECVCTISKRRRLRALIKTSLVSLVLGIFPANVGFSTKASTSDLSVHDWKE